MPFAVVALLALGLVAGVIAWEPRPAHAPAPVRLVPGGPAYAVAWGAGP
jgi:hypothetical protein